MCGVWCIGVRLFMDLTPMRGPKGEEGGGGLIEDWTLLLRLRRRRRLLFPYYLSLLVKVLSICIYLHKSHPIRQPSCSALSLPFSAKALQLVLILT